ncbi:MAG: APC family permease [Actinomyces sp. oral taxon 181]|uniref:APC family permease n=1 Tax=Actinomyces sp. oral taxon 181 TaxID=712121 RepID=UPI0025B7E303|nr:APC family permease [Actinomyces sp. oral taxon 181]MBS4796374.1 APC family permease [Actinomyces sp. oral taxon 181]
MSSFVESAKRVLIGRPIRSKAAARQLLPKRLALPIYASDALSSVAYAPDEILLTLALAGSLALIKSVWVGVVVACVLAVVVLSYRQTVHAYPSGGGDYEVVTTNLGPSWGLLVASALLVDYVLTVAVSISSGANYLTTIFPGLRGSEVPIAVGLIIFLTLVNLRGTREAGTAFAIPTYAYMIAIAVMIIVGFVRLFMGNLPMADSAAYDIHAASTHLDGLTGLGGVFLLMRAFSSGCAALTGVEAISNGVPNFKRPKSRNAGITLLMLGSIAASMMISILVLARHTGLQMVDDTSMVYLHGSAQPDVHFAPVISQLASTIFGDGSLLFIFVTAVTGFILILAANTAFNGFPTLASVLSRDSFLPRQLYKRGDRLSYSNGIMALAVGASALVILFDASVTRLIQLYVVGVFVSFTLSQLGMIRHWNKRLRLPQNGGERSKVLRSRSVNIIGFMMTGFVLAVVLVTKFTHGAWITVLLIGLVFTIQRLIRRHYDTIRGQLRVEDWHTRRALPSRVRALVLVSNLSKPSMRAIATARAQAPINLEIVSVVSDLEEEKHIRREWKESGLPVPLTLVASPFRDITQIVISYVRSRRQRSPEEMLVVYIPEFLVRHWWENILHNQMALRLSRSLLRIPGVVLTIVPWKLGEDIQVDGTQSVNDPFKRQ